MDDRQIQQLVRMALEAQALESPDSSGAFVLAAHRSGWHPSIRWGAAAAGLVGAACIWLALRPAPGSAPPMLGESPADTTSLATLALLPEPSRRPALPAVAVDSPTPAGEHSVVLTIFRDSYGELSCVQWHPHEWGEGRTLAEVTAGELLDAGAQAWCDTGASEMVVVALTGPKGSMPATDTFAQDFAACIAASGDLCELDPSSYSSAALSCLPPGVQAMTQTVPLSLY